MLDVRFDLSQASECKPSASRTSTIAHRPQQHHVRQPVPNDSCYGACCPGVQPEMKDASPKPQFEVTSYGVSHTRCKRTAAVGAEWRGDF